MPSCSQTLSGIARDCSGNMGGIKRVLLANKDDVSTITVTSNQISAITMASSAKFKEYLFRLNTGNMESTAQVNNENGVKYWQTLLTLIFARMETAKRVEIMDMAQADLVGIVEDMNGKFWFLGFENPMFLNAQVTGTGTARTDRNGYSITLEDDSLELPYEVDASIISGLL